MLEEELLKVEEVAGTPGRDNHGTATPPSEETDDTPYKRQKKATLLSMFLKYWRVLQPLHPHPVLPLKSTVS